MKANEPLWLFSMFSLFLPSSLLWSLHINFTLNTLSYDCVLIFKWFIILNISSPPLECFVFTFWSLGRKIEVNDNIRNHSSNFTVGRSGHNSSASSWLDYLGKFSPSYLPWNQYRTPPKIHTDQWVVEGIESRSPDFLPFIIKL